MSKYGTDERGWPLVPVDPAVMSEGYEAVRVGWARPGEVSIQATGQMQWSSEYHYDTPRLIVRPVPKPIRLPLAIVPNNLWVARDEDGLVCVHLQEPCVFCREWTSNGDVWALPSYIAAQLPKEWHDLPWDKSAVQQTEGGEG